MKIGNVVLFRGFLSAMRFSLFDKYMSIINFYIHEHYLLKQI